MLPTSKFMFLCTDVFQFLSKYLFNPVIIACVQIDLLQDVCNM